MKTEIIPVIHVVDTEQVMRNMSICVKAGVKKVFLINHSGDTEELCDMLEFVKIQYPTMWVGVNFLGESPGSAGDFAKAYDADALWVDETLNENLRMPFKGPKFGGFAFKYQRQPADLAEEAKHAIKYTTVLTTSGSGTGSAPTLVKIKTIREAIGDHPMAIASGVSIDNIDMYKGVVDFLLVASSITGKDEIIMADKLKELIDAV